jgi:protoporphyrinogen oxidase
MDGGILGGSANAERQVAERRISEAKRRVRRGIRRFFVIYGGSLFPAEWDICDRLCLLLKDVVGFISFFWRRRQGKEGLSGGGMTEFTIIGAGPAGLAAAYSLAKLGHNVAVFDQDTQVGGLSKTLLHQGFRFDIGGHRFFTKSEEVQRLWQEILGDDFLVRPRLSRIYYRGRLFQYPLKPLNALRNLGVATSFAAFLSYLRARLRPTRPERSFEDWVSNRFGRKLYRIFFQTYSEKVWGIPCTELSADWAAQRIRNLNLGKAIFNALGLSRGKKVASLIDEFHYPRHGPGQMYENMAEKAKNLGADIRLSTRAIGLGHRNGRIERLTTLSAGERTDHAVDRLISSMPLSDIPRIMDPQPPGEVLAAARGLQYRSILTVNLLVRQAEIVPDTWIYLHDAEVRAGRLQFYKNWSPEMVPEAAWSSIGLEYFAFEGDAFWSMNDAQLIELAKADLGKLNLVDAAKVEGGFVARYAKAYPVYNEGYRRRVALLREYLESFQNMVCVGRYGQFRYNNMDHSIMTALLGARKLLGEAVDPWSVNEEAEYHEENRTEAHD